MLEIIALALLTIGAEGGIFLLALHKLWKQGIRIEVNAPVHIDGPLFSFPEKLLLQTQAIPADAEVRETEEPIPVEILEYILQESDGWAQEARKRRVRKYKQDCGNWEGAFNLLQREDNPIGE